MHRENSLAERDGELERLKDAVKNLETERASLFAKVSESLLSVSQTCYYVCCHLVINLCTSLRLCLTNFISSIRVSVVL